jgi:hypothetical protein
LQQVTDQRLADLTDSIGSRQAIVADRVLGAITVIVAVLGMVLYSGYRHPIWIDEFLHFAFGAMSGTSEAWSAIVRSIGGVNFNQTGIYMLADFWLLKLFGASFFALRLPSLLSAVWLLVCATTFLGIRGLGNIWKLVLIIALLAQTSLMNFAAEARPYMPLAAATVGTLAYYATPIERRRGWPRVVGLVSIGLGVLMHPYFPGYWAAMICVGFLLALIEGRARLPARDVLRFCEPLAVAAGLAVFYVVGSLTWLRGAPVLDFDPFQWVHRDQLVVTMIDWTHLAFIYDFAGSVGGPADPRYVLLLLMILTVLACPFVPRRWRDPLLALMPPVALAVGALVISALLSWISYRHHYWILERQWIASVALMPVAVVWYMAELGRRLDDWWRGSSIVLAVGCVAVFSCSLYRIVPPKFDVIRQDVARWRVSDAVKAEPPAEAPVGRDQAARDQWVALANANIGAGGPVWDIFREYYRP